MVGLSYWSSFGLSGRKIKGIFGLTLLTEMCLFRGSLNRCHHQEIKSPYTEKTILMAFLIKLWMTYFKGQIIGVFLLTARNVKRIQNISEFLSPGNKDFNIELSYNSRQNTLTNLFSCTAHLYPHLYSLAKWAMDPYCSWEQNSRSSYILSLMCSVTDVAALITKNKSFMALEKWNLSDL